jgi:hypothetical protein
VHQDVGNLLQMPAYRKPYLVGNLVCLADRYFRVDLYVQINVVLKSRIAGEQLFHSRSARNVARDLPDLIKPGIFSGPLRPSSLNDLQQIFGGRDAVRDPCAQSALLAVHELSQRIFAAPYVAADCG